MTRMTNTQKTLMENTGDLGKLAQAFEKAGVPFTVVTEFEGISLETECGDDMTWSFRSYGKGSGISPVMKHKDPLRTNHAIYPALKDAEVIRVPEEGRVAVKLSGTSSTGKYTEIVIPGALEGLQTVAESADPAISVEERNAFGYTDDVMLPLKKDRALELFVQGFPVYLLYDDNTEAMVSEQEEILRHNGIFGIEREDWKPVKKQVNKQVLPGAKPKSIFLRRDRRNLDLMIGRAKAYNRSPLCERFVEDLEKACVPGVTVVPWHDGELWLCVEMNDGVTTYFLRPCRSGILGMRLDEPRDNSPIIGFPQMLRELFTFEDADEHGGRNFVKLRGRHLNESEWECLKGNGVLDERDRTFDHELLFAGASSAEGVRARRAAMKVVALLPPDTLLKAVYTDERVSDPMPAGEWSARWLRASDPCYEVHCWTMGDFLRFELA